MHIIAQQLKSVLEQLRILERKYQREENSVRLLAVSKTRPAEEISLAFASGQLEFGENYLQEAISKIEEVAENSISWHFIGPVQSNKTRDIAKYFSWLHSLDRYKIARRLSESRSQQQTELNVCIQVNISEEASKSGCAANEVKHLAEQIENLPGLRLRGLMAMPAPANDFSEQRLAFRDLHRLFDDLIAAGHGLDTLSMGTSNDMEAAIAEGATIIRIGTAVFGPRM
ncbi:MAG: YggS family pyridoxal phosphate-dependent enzyme [Gammaproteobacteria bacterium]|nr:YggS family pyridoxal phosphate-dependent enzyme [Gammaproteobacteria bacterium]